jgi:hypothetical protein
LIKKGIVNYAESDRVPLLEGFGISSKLEGWYDMVHDKCFMNGLTDVHVENGSSFIENNGDFYTDNYVYANFLPPGQHKFLIYSPRTGRAYVKSMLVHLNTKEHYPERPRTIDLGSQRPI